MPDWTAAMILALVGVFNMIGTLGSGYLATKFSKKKVLSAIYLLRGVSLIYFLFLPPSIFNSVVFGVTFGLLWLSTVPPTSGIVANRFGTRYLSTLFGIVMVSHQAGAFLGSFVGGLVIDLYGSLDIAWVLAIIISLFSAIIHFPIIEKEKSEEVFA